MDLPLTNPFERINLVRDAALRGDVAGAARGAFDPKAVSPEERKSWVDRYLGDDPGPLGTVLHMVTNPMVLAGLVLTMRYPVATAPRLLEFGQKAASYMTKLPAWSAFFQDFHQIFAGTPLPRLFDYVVKTHHQTFSAFTKEYGAAVEAFEAGGEKYSKQVGLRVAASLDGLDAADHPVWAALREHVGEGVLEGKAGIPTIQLTPGEAKLRDRFREINQTLFRYVRGPNNVYDKDILSALKSDGFHLDKIDDVADYFPHIESLSREELKARYQQWWTGIDKAMADPAYENFQQMLRSNASKRAVARKGLMLPDPKDLKALGVSDEALKLIDLFDNRLLEDGTPAGLTRKYSLSLLKTSENYARSMARMKSWAVPAAPGLTPVGKLILAEYPKVAQASPVKAAMLRDTYIPFARGQITQEAMAPSLRFAETRDWAYEKLKELPLPKSLKDRLAAPLERVQDLTRHSVGNSIADWFYTSALGGNLVSSVKNLSQTLLTTYPTIGGEYTAKGIQEVVKRAPVYTRALTEGLSEEKAFAKAFGEFAEHDFSPGGSSSRSGLADMLGMEADGGIQLPSKYRKVKENVQGKLLLPFQITEQFNRLVAFYGGRAKFLAEGLGSEFSDPVHSIEGVTLKAGDRLNYAASRFGIEIARMTQFGGGPLNSPQGIVKWWAPNRQFLSFPMRTAAFLTGYGVKLGGEGAANYGTIGRAMLAAGFAYEGAKHALGVDASDALLFGALPAPRDRGGFSPAPVPPMWQLIGAGLSSAAKSDLTDLKAALPLTMPGGVGLSRAVTILPGGVATYFGKPYADYNHPAPDGKIAVMTATGQLQDYYEPIELFARAVGLGDVRGQKSRVLRQYFMRQRDRVRDYRTQYLNAQMANDSRAMEEIDNEFQRAYPTLGPIQVKGSDQKRVLAAQNMLQIDRLLKTFPEQARPLFAGIAATSLAADGTGFEAGNYAPLDRSSKIGHNVKLPSNANVTTGKVQQTAVESGQDTRDDMAGNAMNGFEGLLK